jgi:hypothetical protein
VQDTARSVRFFVWGIWTVMLGVALWYVGAYGSNVPLWDDWEWVGVLTRQERLTPKWLWSQQVDHRILFPKVLMIPATQALGCDFRVGMYLQVLTLGALAAAMILTARRLRGSTSYFDAFFPLVMFSLSQYENLIFYIQYIVVVPATLAGVILIVIVRYGMRLPLWAALVAGTCLVLLPLSGASGLAYTPALAIWLIGVAVLRWRTAERRRWQDSLIMIGFAVVAIMLVGLYFVDYRTANPSSPSLPASLRTAVQFLTVGFGAGPGAALWPFSGLLMLTLFVGTAAIALSLWYRQPHLRSRMAGCLFFIGAVGSLTLGIGVGRAGEIEKGILNPGLASRYVSIVLPALCCLYLLWCLLPWHAAARLVQAVLFVLACIASTANMPEALAHGASVRAQVVAFEDDLRKGMSPRGLAQRHAVNIFIPERPETVEKGARMLRRAGVGLFRQLKG